jgi:hypothetical protein
VARNWAFYGDVIGPLKSTFLESSRLMRWCAIVFLSSGGSWKKKSKWPVRPGRYSMTNLAELSALASVLNKETDAYVQSLTDLEKKINRLNLGIEAWIVLVESGASGTPNRETTQRTLLGYAKTEEGWGFAVKEKRVERGYWQDDPDCPWENEYDNGPAKFLLKSSRELRIRAAARIEDLLKALIGRTNEVIPELKKAQELAASL